MTKRLQVSMSEDYYELLQDLAKERGVPVGELIRQAVALDKYVRDRQKEGDVVLMRNEAKATERELVAL